MLDGPHSGQRRRTGRFLSLAYRIVRSHLLISAKIYAIGPVARRRQCSPEKFLIKSLAKRRRSNKRLSLPLIGPLNLRPGIGHGRLPVIRVRQRIPFLFHAEAKEEILPKTSASFETRQHDDALPRCLCASN